MKKTIFTFVMAAILLCSMAVCASALEDYNATLDTATNTYSYTVTYKVAESDEVTNEGEMYGMVAITGVTDTDNPVITEQNIVYIDQATADANGNITFTKFAPMGKTPAETGYAESLVCIGGKGLDGATAIGWLKAYSTVTPEPPVTTTYKISGTVTDAVAGAKKETTVNIYNAGVATPIATTTTVNGAYEIEVTGATDTTVTVEFKKPSFLSLTYTAVPVAENTTLNVSLENLSGDIDGSGQVLMPDINYTTANFRKSAATLTGTAANADVDGSGQVLMPDINATTANFRKSKVSKAYVAQ